MTQLGLQPLRARDEIATGPELSVVVPVFNEEGNIPLLLERLRSVLGAVDHEIVFVDDGSRDESLVLIRRAASANPRIKAISFSRNFGHQVAVTAGLERAIGRAIVIMDADLQDPPEIIPKMMAKWKEGFDVVYGVRSRRDGETAMKRLTARVFYRLLRTLTKFSIPVDTGDFRLVSRRAARAFLAMPERRRFVRGMFSWVGFPQTGVVYARPERAAGTTKYSYTGMIRLALDGITSFSHVPLHLSSYLGFGSAAVGFVLILYSLYEKVFGVNTMRGWTSLSVIVLFLGGIQLIMIGLLGEYLGRVHEELKHRPLYIVEEIINLTADDAF